MVDDIAFFSAYSVIFSDHVLFSDHENDVCKYLHIERLQKRYCIFSAYHDSGLLGLLFMER